MEIVKQEGSTERWVPIPDEVREVYRLWRPTPLYRAVRLEKALKTPAKIYYKWEGVSPPGSHKPNTAVAQAYYAMKEGVTRLTTETGAGQWGSSLAFATKLFGLECTVYMVRVSYQQKPYRKIMMQTWGADVHPSPSDQTEFGKKMLEQDPNHRGSLGIAISEALEDAFGHDDAKYSIGSVVNHVLLHQTVIGLETKKQFEMAEDYPDVMIGCVGGGSNFSGAAFPFVGDKLTGKSPDLEVISCEPTACPSLTRGTYAYDFGDTAGMAPIVMMYTLGHEFIPAPIHAGGLRYHGGAPILCKLTKDGVMDARAYTQKSVFEAATTFARSEGFIVAPETAHAVKGAIDEAIKCRETGEEKTIFFANSGHGHFDLGAYENYFANQLTDYELPQAEIDKALKTLPQI
jgi:tryptophan synthase beta chain